MVVGSLAAALELKRSIEVKKTIVWILVIIVTFAAGFGFGASCNEPDMPNDSKTTTKTEQAEIEKRKERYQS